ncbi:TIGR00266 family protein [Cellvibrio sp. OA-2007]|uniref:TIGR00266 family protein n=1 Tax=Cellvibrio sp. OA-2007 TaxID=529823 RepID=UPI000A0697FC|nr:TIGR00266 family protein [Cellvibrio sp. OA-2007]
MENKYKVQLNGQLAAGADLSSATEKFAQLFKITADKAQQMLATFPVTVKNNVDEVTAQKFKTAIEKTGFLCDIIALAETTAVIDTPETFKGWQYKIEGRPDYGFLTVQIPANETLKVEASAMATMDTHLEMKTKLKGGLGRFLTGENLFLNEFKAAKGAGEIGIAPGTPGDLIHQYIDGQTLFLQNSAFVAATMGVELETKWQGMLKGFFSGESFFLIRASGKGDLWFNSYGAIIEIDVEDDYVVDTGNIVAFTEGMEYEITKVGGYKSLFFSGEGFVCRFRGKGKVWIQTRNAQAFVSWANYFRPVQSKG